MMRIAGLRLHAPVARLLAEIVEKEGFPATAAKVTDAIQRGITTEAPLSGADYGAILETLNRNCPPTLYKLHRVLLEDQRYIRHVTGG
jgi:hypothetical protein